MIRPQISWIAVCAALFPIAATAQDSVPDSASPDQITLDEVVISGGLSPIAANSYGRAYTVVTGKEMEERGLRRVQDALRAMPGVSVSSSGNSMTQLRIRGGEANHTLILIDGVQASGGNDEYILSGLETANIDRIEVLRGPQSVYFGSNASAGVVNIITRRGELGTHYGGAVELGNGYAASGWFTQRTERGGLAFSAAKRDDHGYDLSGDGGEKDGIRRTSLGLTGDWKASEDLLLGFTLRRSKERYDSDSESYLASDAGSYLVDDPDEHSMRNEFTGSAFGEYTMLEGRMVHRLELQDSIFKQSLNDGPETRGETRALKYRLSYGLDGMAVADSNHLLNLMLERILDENTTAPDYDRKNTSLALEYRGFLDNGLDIQAGLRRDNNNSFADFTSWNLGLSYQIADTGLRVHASAGRGMVNPSYYELFGNDTYTLGNPALTPERNTGFDLGLEAELLDGRALIDVTYFNEKLEDEISYVYGAAADGSGRASYVNQRGKSPRQGVEIAGRLQATDDLDLRVSYTYLDAKNPDGSVEIRRPRHEASLSASYAIQGGRGTISGDIRYVSGNYDTQFWGSYATAKLPSYTIVDVAGGYDLTSNVRATARVSNLFDKQAVDVWGFASQGRRAYFGLETKW